MQPGDYAVWGFIISVVVTYNISKYWHQRSLQGKMDLLTRTEKQAWEWLREQGYHLVDAHRRVPVTTTIDGRGYTHTLQADLVVRRDRRTMVVKVRRRGKEVSISGGNASSRRHLLEYNLAYRPDGLILIDLSAGRTRLVSFEVKPKPVKGLGVHWGVLIGAMAGLLVGWLLGNVL